jgi:hypothetical protein
MRYLVALLFLMAFTNVKAQLFESIINTSESSLKELQVGDSILYYQCHVEDVGMQLQTAAGQTLTSNPQKCSITEKMVVVKTSSNYLVRYYNSSLTILPNRKFSGLKIREKSYWNFRLNKEFVLNENQLKILIAIERKGREAIEFDYIVSKYTTNQVIVKQKKNFKQLVIEGDYVLSRLLMP